MITLTRFSSTVAIATFAFFAAATLNAGEVTTFVWHPGVASLASTTIDPASGGPNDDVAGLSPYEMFVTQKDYHAIGPVDITFQVVANGGVTEYSVREGVFNNTGINWSGYHIELGFGHGAGFLKSTPGDGLDFDAPDFNSPYSFAGFFPTIVPGVDDIVASGGIMPYLSFAGYFRFNIDVPDGITEFTLRQSPIGVPEPGTWALASIAAVGLVIAARRKKRG
jgi:hypothetical protein